MNSEDNKCQTCGSCRIVKVTLHGDSSYPLSGFLTLSEVKKRPITSFIGLSSPIIPFRVEGEGILCLDCGAVNASFSANIEKAKKVVEMWGSSELKSRLQINTENV